MNKYVEEFKENVLNGNASFLIREESGRNNFFASVPVGNSRLIYSDYSYSSEAFDVFNAKPELVAVTDGVKIFMICPSQMGLFRDDFYDNDVIVCYYDYVKSLNEQMIERKFKPFYEALELIPLSDDAINSLRQQARALVLKYRDPESEVPSFFDAKSYMQYLCGFIDADAYVDDILAKDVEKWQNVKSLDNKLKELVDSGECAEPWEIDMVNGIKSVDANTLNVTFEYNNMTASEKVEPLTLIRMIYEKDYFSSFNFVVTKRGEELLKTLGVKEHDYSNPHSRLRCSNIIRISYGKKVLFER